MTRNHLIIIIIFCVTAWASGAGPTAAGEAATPRFAAHDEASTRVLDHGAWDGFLGRYRKPGDDGIARLDYAAVDAGDRAELAAYIAGLEAAPVTVLTRAEQLAFWLNLYNAVTVALILDHWPLASIRELDISPDWLADGPWGAPLATVEGVALSLDAIEHEILRPIWRDPRIHYGLNCASLGCPDLPARAFRAERVDAMLDAAARAFVNHSRGVRVTPAGEIAVSSLYEWYAEDFGGSDEAVIAHLRRYAEPALAARLADAERIADHAYDWAINAPSATAGSGK